MCLILFSYEKEGHPAICHNIDGLEGIVLNEIRQRKTIGLLFHLHVKFEKAELRRVGATWGREMLVKEYKLPVL